MHSLFDVFQCIDTLYNYLEQFKLEYNKSGFPIFTKEMFLCKYPQLVIPYYLRNNKIVDNKKSTLLCFYCPDFRIYPRFSKIEEDIATYKEYMGVIGSDITVTADMDIEWQNALMLLNQLHMVALAANDIKIVFNLRNGNGESLKNFSSVPKNIMCASGFLGCERQKSKTNFHYLTKVMSVKPSKLILYGKKDIIIENQLDLMGIDYKRYDDFHTISKRGAA